MIKNYLFFVSLVRKCINIPISLGFLHAKQKIDAMPKQHPFELRYHVNVGKVDWESCAKVLDSREKRKHLMAGWR